MNGFWTTKDGLSYWGIALWNVIPITEEEHHDPDPAYKRTLWAIRQPDNN